MSPDELDKLERQRRDADQRYNEALTAFDAALVRTAPPAAAALAADATPLPSPAAGWRGWPVRAVQQWLAPWMERQHLFNARAAGAVEALVARDRERTAAFEQFQASLIALLQHITAFVETKDRQVSAQATLRLDEHQRIIGDHGWFIEEQRPLLATLPELRAHLTVLQRATAMLQRRLGETAPAQAGMTAAAASTAAPAAASGGSLDDYKYVGFEDQFRGSEESVAATFDEYLPIFAGAADVVDLGCGRGEFLAALQSSGVRARGVDSNEAMVAVARERGLDATQGDALGYLAALPDESIGGLIATQVVEHLEPSYLNRLLDASARRLRPGAPIVLETINPACWYAFFSSYIRDPTHVRPVHPETLQYLLRASGFERVEIRYRSPLPEHVKLKTLDGQDVARWLSDPSTQILGALAQTINANAVTLNTLLFGYMDYAVIGYRS
jgi:SAM-dependent methyltransferase